MPLSDFLIVPVFGAHELISCDTTRQNGIEPPQSTPTPPSPPPLFFTLFVKPSLLNRITAPNSLTNLVMNSNYSSNGGEPSQRLKNLAQQLRLYKLPPQFDKEDIEDSDQNESESAAQIPGQPKRFKPKRAAVLICLFEDDNGDLRVILTKRSSTLSSHSGEVSLPGGKAEEGDADDAETALREAKEEIGLDPSLVEVVAVLQPVFSKQLLRVVPVVGLLSNRQLFKPVPNAAEVEAVFDAPLEMFLKDENRTSQEREIMGIKFVIHLFDYEVDETKFLIWGLTAGLLIRAASVVYQRPPSFEEHIPDVQILKLLMKKASHLQ